MRDIMTFYDNSYKKKRLEAYLLLYILEVLVTLTIDSLYNVLSVLKRPSIQYLLVHKPFKKVKKTKKNEYIF